MNESDLLVFARCAGFAFRAPGFAHPNVPRPVRAGFAAVLAYALAPGSRRPLSLSPAALALALATESAIGASIGMAAAMLYDAAYAGGRTLDDYAGIRGSVPAAGVLPGSAFGRLWSLTFTAGFFLLGGVELTIAAFAHGLIALPPGAALSSEAFAAFALRYPVTLTATAAAVAGPAVALAFLTQIALGSVARVVPRFATFALSFAAVFAMALLATLLALPFLDGVSGHPPIDLPFLHAHGR